MWLPSDIVNYWIFFTNVRPYESWLTDYNLSLLAKASQTDCICIGSSLLYSTSVYLPNYYFYSRNSVVFWYDTEIVWKANQYNIFFIFTLYMIEPVLHSQYILWLCKHTTSGKCSVELAIDHCEYIRAVRTFVFNQKQ